MTSTAIEDEKYHASLFDGTNYHAWKYRMEILLDDKKLLPYVTQKVTYEALPEESFENAVERAHIVFANNLH